MNILQPYVYIHQFDNEATLLIRNRIDEIAIGFVPEQPILVEINSLGGNGYNMLSIYEHFKTLPNPIISYTNSVAMSAGAILLSALGSPGNRFASPNAAIMIHEIQDGIWGDKKDIVDYVKDMTQFNDRIMTILAKSMKLKDHEDIVKIIKDNAKGNNLYLNAEQAKELNVIDHIAYLRMVPRTTFDIATSLSELDLIPKVQKKRGKK